MGLKTMAIADEGEEKAVAKSIEQACAKFRMPFVADALKKVEGIGAVLNGTYADVIMADIGSRFLKGEIGEKEARLEAEASFKALVFINKSFAKHFASLPKGMKPEERLARAYYRMARDAKLSFRDGEYLAAKSIVSGFIDCDLGSYLMIQLASGVGIGLYGAKVATENPLVFDHYAVVFPKTGQEMIIETPFLLLGENEAEEKKAVFFSIIGIEDYAIGAKNIVPAKDAAGESSTWKIFEAWAKIKDMERINK